MQPNITWHEGNISKTERCGMLGQYPVTIWLTGLSGAGKSTLAFALEKRLMLMGHIAYVLDGDNVRHGLNRDLGFSAEDRKENIRRVAEVARLFNDAGLFVITAFISPYREDRAMARSIIGGERFVETYLSTDIDECERRDPKGLYRKARTGLMTQFTGVSAPYEAPDKPGISLDTAQFSVDECVDCLITQLQQQFCKQR